MHDNASRHSPHRGRISSRNDLVGIATTGDAKKPSLSPGQFTSKKRDTSLSRTAHRQKEEGNRVWNDSFMRIQDRKERLLRFYDILYS